MNLSWTTSNVYNLFDEIKAQMIPQIADEELEKRSNKLAAIMRKYIPGKGEGRTGVNSGRLQSDIRAYKVASRDNLPRYIVTVKRGSKAQEYALYVDQGRGPVVGSPWLGNPNKNSDWAKWQRSIGVENAPNPVKYLGPAEGYYFVEKALAEF